MATNTTIANLAARAACDAVVDRLDLDTPPATIKIYDNTAPGQPANPDVAVTTQVLLGTLTCSNPAFNAAADADPGGIATAQTITDDTSADATGTAAWFRGQTGTAGTGVIDGTIGTASADLILNTVSIVAGATISISSWTVTMPES